MTTLMEKGKKKKQNTFEINSLSRDAALAISATFSVETYRCRDRVVQSTGDHPV